MYFSTAPMVTLSKPFSMTQLPSHSRSCGQMRPQISGKVLVAEADLVGLLQPALGGQLQPVRDVVVQRAMHLAERHAALRAAAGLLGRLLAGELAIDLVEVVGAFRSVPAFGQLLLKADELQHTLGHTSPPIRRGRHERAFYIEGDGGGASLFATAKSVHLS